MTVEITEFKCPTCGHILGEEQFTHACQMLNRIVIERAEEREAIKEEQHKKEIQMLNEKHEREKDSEINGRVEQERAAMQIKYNRQKESYIEAAKLQGANDNEAKHKQKDKEFQIQFDRVKAKNEELQKIVDNVPPELRGAAGEFVLLDELRSAFPNDDIQPKKYGKEMADVVQIIITETGEKILPPIVYEMKTGDTVTPTDIEKAKLYKDIHNTDNSIIVTAKGIRPRDCETKHSTLIGNREGIVLLHPTVVVGIARHFRNFIIENAKRARINDGSESKYKKAYDYITSPERFRKIQEKIQIKLKLDELQTNEEDYHKRKWKKEKIQFKNGSTTT